MALSKRVGRGWGLVLPGFVVLRFVVLGFVVSGALAPTALPEPYPLPDLRFFPPLPPSQNPPTREGVALGRHLFYDPILSADSSISCAHCHRQETAFADGGVRFSKGISQREMKRNTQPLFNLGWYSAYFWDGKAPTLEAQVFHPVRDPDEMNLDWKRASERIRKKPFYQKLFHEAFGAVPIDSSSIAMAIAQFEQTLISADSKYDRVLRHQAYFTPDEYQGFLLVNLQNKGDCLHCHTTNPNALGTTGQFSNNGLDKSPTPKDYTDPGRALISGREQDAGLFRIPSFRNVGVTAPYMHDGRFGTLEEVVQFYSTGVNTGSNVDSKMGNAHRGGVHLTPEEQRKVVAFLHTLTDSTFLRQPEFGNPWGQRERP